MKKSFALVAVMIMVAGAFSGCESNVKPTEDNVGIENQVDDEVTGTVSMNGSTSMEKLASAINEGFMAKYPKTTATAEFTGSGAGIEAVANGTVNIGNSSRNLKPEELAKGLIENVVAIDGIAMVTYKDNSVNSITKEQLASIYDGTIRNWSELGGKDQMIVVIGREASSGTRSAFEELLDVADKCKYAQEIDSTGAVMAKVSVTAGAIGYVSLDVIDDSVKALSLNEIEPTAENIKAGKYILSRPFVMATKGAISEQDVTTRAMFDYVNGEEGQAIIAQVGLISVK